MPFYASAYDTTAARGISVTKIIGSLSQALLRENFAIVNNQNPAIQMPIPEDGCVPTLLTTQTDIEMSVPIFSHPIFVDISSVRKSPSETYMISDVRPFMLATRVSDRESSVGYKIKNQTEFDFTKNRTILSSIWYKRNTDAFLPISHTLTEVYSSWISEGIARRFGLDSHEQLQINVMAAYHFRSLFYPYSKFDENDILRIASNVARACYVSVEDVLGIIEQFPVMEGLFDFCKHVQTLCNNPRLDDLNPGLMVSMFASSWYGTNGREIAAVALEHVPTFAMIVYGAFTYRTYHSSTIAKITERLKGRKGEDLFVQNMQRLVKEHL